MVFKAVNRENIPESCIERFLQANGGRNKVLSTSRILLGGISLLRRGFYAERARIRDFHIVNITMEGSGIFEMEDGKKFEVTTGDMFISPAEGMGHKHYPVGDEWKIIWLHIGGDANWITPSKAHYEWRICHNLTEIYSSMDNLIRESLSNEHDSIRLQELFAESLLIYLKREFSEKLTPELNVIRYRMNHLWNLVNSQLSFKWTVERMAEQVGLSRTHFFRLCYRIYGKTPGDKVKEMRMIRAEQMLLNFENPIYIISEAIGYENPNTFISAFKSFYGRSPMKYKREKSR